MSSRAITAVEAAANPWISWDYIVTNSDKRAAAAREHIVLTVTSVGGALLLAFPLAVLVRRYRRLQSPVLALSGVLYTIPSLALISLLWPIFGLSPLTVIIALTSYALLVVLRNTVVGLDDVDAEVLDAARGMGMGDRGVLWRVEVPLAMPTILAGIRIATVSTVGMVTVGALVGYGGFGSLILSGFQQNFWHAQIFTATAASVLLAIIFDVLLHGLERLSTPWARDRAAA